ncbi:MAG: alpha/beta hydrolase [Candidatus Dormibacteria bacterium]
MRSVWARDGDRSLHLADFGGQGPAVILVHGLGGSWADWSELGPALTHMGHVLAVDLPGFGLTPLEGRGAALADQARLIGRLVDGSAANGRVLLAGNSAGALAALMAARVRADRLRGLVLIDAVLPRRSWLDVDPLLAAIFAALLVPRLASRYLSTRSQRLGAEGMVRDSLAINCAHPERVPERAIEALTEVARQRESVLDPATAYVLTARSVVAMLSRRERVYRVVDAAPVDVLLLHGNGDRLIPVQAARDAAARRPDWRLEVLDDHGHLPQLEDAPLCARLIDEWLQRKTVLAGSAPRQRVALAGGGAS